MAPSCGWPETLRAIVAAVGRRRPVSATVGDLPPDPERLRRARKRNADAGGLHQDRHVRSGRSTCQDFKRCRTRWPVCR